MTQYQGPPDGYRQNIPRPKQQQPQRPGWPTEQRDAPQYSYDPYAGKATTALTLGIVSLLLNILFVPGILAIVFGAQAMGPPYYSRNKAGWGLALGIIGTVIQFIVWVWLLGSL
jgi:hypothetical protein